jgi:hypothetical protein
MCKPGRIIGIPLAVMLPVLASAAVDVVSDRAVRAERPVEREDKALRYRITASKPRLNRRLMAPPTRFVQGVPSEPVDSMCWNGEGSVPIEGSIVVDVMPMRNVGRIAAEWTDENGEWSYKQKRFTHPDHHSSGVRIGPSVTRIDTIINEGIAHNVYLHGDTAAGMPVMPTTFTYLATWGPAHVIHNGEVFRNPFEIPAPLWLGHLMVTEGVRRSDGTVRTLSDEIYNPSHAAEGAVEQGDLEVHLTFHDDLFPVTGNVPPPFSFFYHLVFEDVQIEILQGDGEESSGF